MFDQIQRISATGRSSIHPTHFRILAIRRISAMGRSSIHPLHFFNRDILHNYMPMQFLREIMRLVQLIHAFGSTYQEVHSRPWYL